MKSKFFVLALAAAAGTALAQNTIVSNIAGTFVDISANPSAVGLAAFDTDDGTFTFTSSVTNTVFTSTTVRPCSNGFVQWGGTGGGATYTNTAIPAGTTSPVFPTDSQALFPYWDDQYIYLDTGANIYWVEGPAASFGLPAAAGNVLIIQWNNSQHYFSSTSAVTYQVQVFQNPLGGTVAAQMLYQSTSFGDPLYDDGASATVGFASGLTGGPGSTENVQWSFDTPGNILPGTVLSLTRSTASVPPTVTTTTATPHEAPPGTPVVYTVTVVPGANPTSTGITVRGDLSGIGGPGNALFHDDGLNGDATGGDGIHSLAYTLPGATPGGAYTIAVTATDAQARSGTGAISASVYNPTNLGTITADRTENGTVPAAGGLYYRFTLAQSYTLADNRFFDIDTNGSGLNDTMLALYAADGTLLATDDDSGIGLKSCLSFGAGGGTAAGDGGSASTGIDGGLAAGDYLLAVAEFFTAFASGPNNTYPVAGAGGDVVVNFSLGNAPPPPPTYDELVDGGGDAGSDTSTAFVPSGTGELGRITGNIEFAGDADVYKIRVCDVSNFSVTTSGTGPGATVGDTQLFLFNLDGTGVVMDDDAPPGTPGAGSLFSSLTNAFVTAEGDYYLAISRYDNDPTTTGGGTIWLDQPFNAERTPDGDDPTGALATFDGGSAGTGIYRITMTGVCYPGAGNACGPADVGSTGGTPGADNHLDNNDFVVYIEYFFTHNPIADMGTTGGVPGSDGAWDNNDFVVYIDYFFSAPASCR